MQTPSESGTPPHGSPKLYRLRDDRMVEGICAGIAAYLGVDPTPIRIVAVVLLALTGGAAAVVYLVLVVVIPQPKTPEERAAAHGYRFDADEPPRGAKAKLQGYNGPRSDGCTAQSPTDPYEHRDHRKGCLGVILTLAAFIFGVSLLMTWLRWPFNSSVIRETLITPYQPWAELGILVAVIVALGTVVGKLVRSERTAGSLLLTILRFCLLIFVLLLVIYLASLAWTGILALGNMLFQGA